MGNKKKSNSKSELGGGVGSDDHLLINDVASFASALGLSSASTNDSKPLKQSNNKKKKRDNKPNKEQPKPRAQPPVALLDNNYHAFDKFKNLPKLPLVKASSLGIWYADAADLELKLLGNGDKTKVVYKNVDEWKLLVSKKKDLGERLMAQYAQDFETSRGKSGDIKMLTATQRSGTAADKVSAFSVMVGENPVANIKSLDALIGMVTSKVGKRHALTGFEALKEMFISSLLPERKLKSLFQRPVNQLPESKDGYSLLLFWYWEECLKQRYERFVFALEEASKDVLAVLKDKALKTMYTLLSSKSEQERRLLAALVNKLGDPENKAASNADYHLSKLLSDHPNMKALVIDEVDNFLFRPHLGLRSKYHAVNFLSQVRLSHKGDGPQAAKRLVDVYFALFKVLISEAGRRKVDNNGKEEHKKLSVSREKEKPNASESHVEMDSRLLSALLTGVNRAFPFVSSNEADDILEVQTPMLFQLVHSKNFNVGVQALLLLDKISSKNQLVSDRFYRALYSKLLFPAAMNSSKEEMFIGLLLRAMKSDVNLKRVAAFAKRLLQVALQQPPQYACGCLFLLSEVLKARPPLWNMILQNESADDDDEHFEDVLEDAENNVDTISDKPNVFVTASSREAHEADNSDSSSDKGGGSTFGSEDEVSDEGDDLFAAGVLNDPRESEVGSNHAGPQSLVSNDKLRASLPGGYDPRHREPSYCKADCVSWWELMVLAAHAHPSVATMAKTLLSGANIVYNGNPLHDLSLPAFLDKFMEKKPKQSKWHGGSDIEPAKKLDMSNHLIGPEIISLAEMDVAPEDLVFHKFYMNKMNSSKKQKKKKKKTTEDEAAEELYGGNDDDDDDESDNEEIDNILDSGNPSLEADGDYDYDDLDRIANEDDDDLVGNESDEGMDFPEDIADEEGADTDDNYSDNDDDGGNVDIGEADDGSDEEDLLEEKNRKRKPNRQNKASPFASIEEYEHLLNEESPAEKESDDEENKHKKGRSKSKKKRKTSK
ncbi:CCAAT/enhancer-binding protein zeta-like [Heracleum sosnowskyi]|uniref:CCAAT/enhancer-binding protein zeta-like n=1 Tax=Heracleum sosnowskyi TaxID=360622 RepID=A0AAD8M876_9APIA|nr:CCAAT/enhancer-binding protein zeta-like [Heracleum sosnowskyi]